MHVLRAGLFFNNWTLYYGSYWWDCTVHSSHITVSGFIPQYSFTFSLKNENLFHIQFYFIAFKKKYIHIFCSASPMRNLGQNGIFFCLCHWDVRNLLFIEEPKEQELQWLLVHHWCWCFLLGVCPNWTRNHVTPVDSFFTFTALYYFVNLTEQRFLI